MDRYINLFTDFGFKKVFGEELNKDLLISFLNTLLPARHQIDTLEYSRNEWQGLTAFERRAIIDLHCKTQDGTYFIVELQKAKQNYFKDRALFYASFPIQEQGQKGEWDFKLKAIYTIGILDFFFDDTDRADVIHTVQLKNQKNQVFYDKLTFIYLTMPNFTKPLKALTTLQDKWLFVFRHLPELADVPPSLQEDIFQKLFHIAELVTLPRQERMAYEDSLKHYRDLKNVTDTAYGDGMADGRQIGRQEGLLESEFLILQKQMIKRFGPLPTDVVEKITGATRQQLEKWLDRILDAKNVADLFDVD